MRVRLEARAEDAATVTFVASATLPGGPLRLRYPTRTGALLRIDGVACGAFDAMHEAIVLGPMPGAHELALEVERRSLPISGLPSGDGVRWRWMLARAGQRPPLELEIETASAPPDGHRVDVPLVGHAHLDVAWLWTYEASKRKALRTFATALREIENDDRFIFAQSMPQLYAWVGAGDPHLLERVRTSLARNASGGGWDASVASMWVESDTHMPSGESLLRQFAHGIAWTRERLGVEPSVAWLPDSFGFPSTFPQLAAHAGVPYFATTKLQWNETTRWPYPRFRWIGDDGSSVTAAVIASYEGPIRRDRLDQARKRDEILVHGYGDGGGGPTDDDLAFVARDQRPWTRVSDWMASFEGSALPDYRGELYLETHRGTYTTHHGIKRCNAVLERKLAAAEELAAWCVAVRAPETVRRSLAEDLRNAWRIVLRAQFHDVLPGTAIPAVFADVYGEYDRAQAIAGRVTEAAASILPRSDVRRAVPPALAPRRDGDDWIFENTYVRARARSDGTIVELGAAGGPNLVAVANGLLAYVDKPKAWDAWNVDAGYLNRRVAVKRRGGTLDDDGLLVRLEIGKRSRAAMRLALHEDEPWLRVELAVAWHEDHVLLRAEHRVALAAREVRYGQPHGTLVRTAYPQTPAERAKFEVPAQRWAHVEHEGAGLAVFTTDLYGWNGVGLRDGGVRLGTSLLRAPTWPDPGADRGDQQLEYALVPTAGASIFALEQAWQLYAEEPRVRLFTCDDDGVLIVATYPSADANAVIVRVRECDGVERRAALRCGGRMREAIPVDATERVVDGDAAIVEEALVMTLPPFALRSFLVRF